MQGGEASLLGSGVSAETPFFLHSPLQAAGEKEGNKRGVPHINYQMKESRHLSPYHWPTNILFVQLNRGVVLGIYEVDPLLSITQCNH